MRLQQTEQQLYSCMLPAPFVASASDSAAVSTVAAHAAAVAGDAAAILHVTVIVGFIL